MATMVVFAPSKIQVVKKGRMIMLYDISNGQEPDHICSFFHEHKLDWAVARFEEAGVEVVLGEGMKPKSNGKVKRVRRVKK